MSKVMAIQILGLACPKVRQTVINARAAASAFEDKPDVRWINDVHKLSAIGAFIVPTLMIGGQIKSSGRVPSVYEIRGWIEEEMDFSEYSILDRKEI